MTLLDEWSAAKPTGTISVAYVYYEQIRRALAIAQAVEEAAIASDSTVEFIMRRADELLK